MKNAFWFGEERREAGLYRLAIESDLLGAAGQTNKKRPRGLVFTRGFEFGKPLQERR